MRRYHYLFIILLSLLACNSSDSEVEISVHKIDKSLPLIPEIHQHHRGFELLRPEKTGVDFTNVIIENHEYYIFNYDYLYNGGGVAAGDLNNNGLPDLYFVSTFGENKLYENKGNYQFEDITERAGVGAAEGFKTGVTFVDINGNGFLDIYVCRTGKEDDTLRTNLLFINNGDMTFTERAAEFGINSPSYSTHANFFDMNGNGELDLYLMNHPIDFDNAIHTRLRQNEEGEIIRLTHPRTPYESDQLFMNKGGKFVDISEAAGVLNSAYGLSVIVSDINLNGRQDIFVGNDFIEPDHLFINNGDHTFTDKALDYFDHMSQHSMGADIADFNNDGLVDIVVLDMLADDHVRYKELINIMTVSRHNLFSQYGYGHQYVRNVLQQNRGVNSKGEMEFSEIARIAGVSSTDWSWGALLADFTNNTLKDLHITNGFLRDLTNHDFSTYTRDSILRAGYISPERYPDINEFLNLMPSNPIPNYLFLNNGDLTFFDVSEHWNVAMPTFSSGSAYADLNGDGNLDLIINNINEKAFIKRNLGSDNNYLQITLKGPGNNTRGIGTKAWATTADLTQYLELNGNRGFLSTSEHMFHFGLNDFDTVDELLIVWPDNTYQKLRDVQANQRIQIEYKPQGIYHYPAVVSKDLLFSDRSGQMGLDFHHIENDFEDFNRERLIPHRLSRFGPGIAIGDVNGNGLEDIYIGGAEGQSGVLFVQQSGNTFVRLTPEAFVEDREKEDEAAHFFDSNGNGFMDLLVLSGGYNHPVNHPLYNDRLYINDGKGNFTRDATFPKMPSHSGALLVHDFTGNGEELIFIGARALPLNYPTPPVSYVVKKREGRYQNLTREIFPEFERLGMITAIEAADLNGNGTDELIVTGEWMPIMIFSYENGNFVDRTAEFGLENTNGWWNNLRIEDLNGDGQKEIIAGNLGLNARFAASQEEPLLIIADDFDRNGMIDPIMCYYHAGKIYPYPGRDLLLGQLPHLKRKFPRFRNYSGATIQEVLDAEQIENALTLRAYKMESTVFYLKDGKYHGRALPNEAQLSKVFDILVDDFNNDGIKDLLLVGNFYYAELESGPYNASKGVLLLGNDDGWYDFKENRYHGLWATYEARKINKIRLGDHSEYLIIANNDGPLQTFKINTSDRIAF